MYAAIGEVLSGWTGALTAGGVTVTPRARESVVSLLCRLVQDVYTQSPTTLGQALRLSWSLSSTGVVTLTGDSAFTLAATSNTATRTGLTSTYTGQSTYTAASAFAGVYVASSGVALDLPSLYDTEGSAVADGTLAWTGPEQPARATLSLWTTYAESWSAELMRGEYDVWGKDRMLGRIFVERFSRVPPSRLLRSGMMEVRGEGTATYVAEGLPFEIPEEWPVAQGWLYSWVDTSVLGYRAVDFDATSLLMDAGYVRFDDLVADFISKIETESGGGAVEYLADGRINFYPPGGATASIVWVDRLGWLLGFGLEAGSTDDEWVNSDTMPSRFVPPGGIPCLGVSWREVEIQSEAEAIFDRHRRRQGFVFGAARLWRLRITLTRWALQSLLTGWCLRGRVTAVCGSNTTAIGPSESGGAITGFVLGLDRVSWLDPEHQRRAVVELSVVSEGA